VSSGRGRGSGQVQVARARQINHVITLKYFSKSATFHSPLMDASERNAAYIFANEAQFDCGCKELVFIHTRDQHIRKKMKDKSRDDSNSGLQDSATTGAADDVKMTIETSDSDPGAQDSQNLVESSVARLDSKPLALGTLDVTRPACFDPLPPSD
jgi:hypothetical protein